ncbi:unnamed protein product [Cochlearia groenlandica]
MWLRQIQGGVLTGLKRFQNFKRRYGELDKSSYRIKTHEEARLVYTLISRPGALERNQVCANLFKVDWELLSVWKLRMKMQLGATERLEAEIKAIIRGIDEDAWTAIEEGWEEPKVMGEKDKEVPKPKKDWTVEEKKKKMSTKGKSIAQVSKQKTAQTSDFEDQVSLIVKKYFKEMEIGQRKFSTSGFRPEEQSESERAKRPELKCHVCQKLGHYKNECPNLKTKEGIQCFECKGYGHLKSDCVNKQRRAEKSYITFSESDYDQDGTDVEDIINMVGYLGIIEEGSESGSEKESCLLVEEENQVLVQSLLKFQDENKGLRENLQKSKKSNRQPSKREMRLLVLENN